MFGTSGVRGRVGSDVTADLALDIARALATDADRVVVGRDVRDSGRALVDALCAGLTECGADVIDVGTASTPTIARAIGSRDADAGVAVTASHNPPQDNGIKLWTPSGQAFDETQLAAIERRVDSEVTPFADWDGHGDRTRWDGAADAHRRTLLEVGRRRAAAAGVELDGFHAVVDVGNGTGGITADVLHELGATVETLNAQPDGRFPGRPSEPTAEACTGLIAHVAARGADLGIAHDGDADRMMAVDDTGRFRSGDELLTVFALQAVAAGDRVAAPVDTSLAVDDALAARGASVVRTRVGDAYVADRTREEGVVFGGEPSGAWIFPTETRCPDGPLAAVALAVLAADRPLSERADELPTYPIRREAIETTRTEATMAAVTERVRESYDDVTGIDGVRVEVDDGWFLIRASGTQPLIRVTAEARDPETADRIRSTARSFVVDAIADLDDSTTTDSDADE
ncbi:phosphoglucosamine mutase [Halorubrum sp. HHNYT27]|uniref:phosphoglucosamine mutase n=1 Tax=Halorubrum sp. HHNYT27 TaxID=3402275 RepID=UPI003EBFB965